MSRDCGGPSLVYQLLLYPVTNYAFDTRSHQECGEGFMLTTDMMMWNWNLYLRNEADSRNPYASPLQADDLSDLPPETQGGPFREAIAALRQAFSR